MRLGPQKGSSWTFLWWVITAVCRHQHVCSAFSGGFQAYVSGQALMKHILMFQTRYYTFWTSMWVKGSILFSHCSFDYSRFVCFYWSTTEALYEYRHCKQAFPSSQELSMLSSDLILPLCDWKVHFAFHPLFACTQSFSIGDNWSAWTTSFAFVFKGWGDGEGGLWLGEWASTSCSSRWHQRCFQGCTRDGGWRWSSDLVQCIRSEVWSKWIVCRSMLL